MNEAKKTTIQLLKYGIIGLSNTFLTLVAFYLLNTQAGISAEISNAAGYVIGLVNSFVWNKSWVFKSKNNLWKEASLFTIGFLICYGLQFAMFWFLLNATALQHIEISWLPMKNTGENIAICLSMVVYTLANYCYNRFVTFKK